MLRQEYKSLLRQFFSKEIQNYRAQSKLTQEQISELLCMAPRSYVDLENGTYGCSALTVVLFLLQLKDEEILQLLRDVKKELEEADRHGAA